MIILFPLLVTHLLAIYLQILWDISLSKDAKEQEHKTDFVLGTGWPFQRGKVYVLKSKLSSLSEFPLLSQLTEQIMSSGKKRNPKSDRWLQS